MKKKILIYCLIAYGITWVIAFGIYLLFKNGDLNAYQLNLYHSWAAVGPAIAAVITTFSFYGTAGLKKLFDKLKPSIPNKRGTWYILSPVLFFVFGLVIYRIANHRWYNFEMFGRSNWASSRALLVWALPLFTYAIFEEIGWRGFLLPHLQEKYTAWRSTFYLTIIWALWHLPFFFYRFDFSLFMSIGFLFGIFVGSIILTSIYNSSKGFLVSVMLFHFVNNLCSMFDKELIAAVMSTGFVFLAISIYRKYGRLNLSEMARTGNYLKGPNPKKLELPRP
jgi:membrane protease YdiL (CAAX protease family)